MYRIFNLHAVKDPVWLDRLILWLKSRHELVSLGDLMGRLGRREEGGEAAHISVDDGDRSFVDIIFPAIVRHRVPVSLYVSPQMVRQNGNFWFQEVERFDRDELRRMVAERCGVPASLLGGYRIDCIMKSMPVDEIHALITRYRDRTGAAAGAGRNLTVAELKEVAGSGLVEVGAHTLNHPILGNESDARSRYEIRESVRQLSEMLGRRTRYFAYPNGLPGLDFRGREMLLLEEAGIELAFTTVCRGLTRADHRLCLPRVGISDGEGLPRLSAKMRLDRVWHLLALLKPAGEPQQRKRLKRILANALAPDPRAQG